MGCFLIIIALAAVYFFGPVGFIGVILVGGFWYLGSKMDRY